MQIGWKPLKQKARRGGRALGAKGSSGALVATPEGRKQKREDAAKGPA